MLAMLNGAQERTRTSTPLRAPAPEAGASTNSATWAQVLLNVGRARDVAGSGGLVNQPSGAPQRVESDRSAGRPTEPRSGQHRLPPRFGARLGDALERGLFALLARLRDVGEGDDPGQSLVAV
jgi:hypothetical protein